MQCATCGYDSAPNEPCVNCGAPIGASPRQSRLPAGIPYDAQAWAAQVGWQPEWQQSIRTGIAIAGGVIGLIAALVGLNWALLTNIFLSWRELVGFAAYAVPAVVAVVLLTRIDRLVVLGLLQGMWWPAAAWVAQDTVSASVDHAFGATGRLLVGYWVGVSSDVLGVCAAILLLVSWSRTVTRRRTPRLRPLPVLLLCGVGMSQIVFWIFLAQYKIAADDVLGAAALLVGLAVTWFALSMSDRAAGGALVLGWFTLSSFIFISGVYTWTTTAWLECLLVAVSVAMALAYIREPSRAQSPAF